MPEPWEDGTANKPNYADTPRGHYLMALAQAYAGSAYDKDLQANFAQKMDYMVNVLYELAQLSGTPQSPGGACVTDPCQVPPAEGKANYDSDLSEKGIRTDYWNWGKGFISAYPPDQFILLEQGATYGGSNLRCGHLTTPCIKFWSAGWIFMKSAETKKPSML